jgi:outer membrane immunogenic protein
MNRKIIEGFAVSALLIAVPLSIARAADMPLKAPPPPPAPIWSWTGFYLGGNVGYSSGRSSNLWNVFAPTGNLVIGGGCAPLGTSLCETGSDSNRLNGALGGLQAGYNWQTRNFLVGIESDIQISGQKGDNVLNFPAQSIPAIVGDFFPPVTAAYSEKLPWLGTLRGRIGLTADRWLIYGTGGLAYGEVKIAGSAASTGIANFAGCSSTGVCPLAGWSNSVTRTGWALGGGIEGAIGNNCSLKVEYLHVDLGTVTTSFATAATCLGTLASCNLLAAGTGTINSKIIDEVVRVGLNYRFGYDGPLSTK